MKLVVALGGNALLRRDQAPTAEHQLENIRRAAVQLAPVAATHFEHPSKPIGPVYSRADAERIAAERHWTMAPDGQGLRRVVASPQPLRVLGVEPIRWLLAHGHRGGDGQYSTLTISICAMARIGRRYGNCLPRSVRWSTDHERRLCATSPAAAWRG